MIPQVNKNKMTTLNLYNQTIDKKGISYTIKLIGINHYLW
jgi:hypothetical protein